MGTKIYQSEERAQARVSALRQAGIWPGYRRVPGGWALTFDPPGSALELDAHGYLFAGTDTMSDG